MLRERSRATSKQALTMADYGSLPSPTDRFSKPTSSIFCSPRLFTGFTSKNFTDTESVLSPTSILDHKPFSALRNPFFSDKPNTINPPKPEIRSHWDKLDSRGVGLGIVDELTDEMSEPYVSKPRTRMVLFGSQLKIQIPPLRPSVAESVKSPAVFGIKTKNSLFVSSNSGLENSNSPKSTADYGIKKRNSQSGSANPGLEISNSQLGFVSPSSEKKPPFGSENSAHENPNSPLVFAASLSASEMELSEDYTCVILHGPNPRTTHIFDNCIVESCCGGVGISGVRKGNGFCGNQSMSYPSENFLSFCYSCKKNLGQGKDTYMYRGEKAFCSSECRHKEMLLEEDGAAKMESLDADVDVFRASS
ncbi:hypothetical protein CEY00_Acc22788 [Actinidia chinensis var. chinensis]|uniref:FLZ-type domain-containing protein n=1 Tax=Actinidia chinensis var. chinensis TaxID=1590841 RepID=A0A2R6Q3Z9_ACTCC|nr:hypothetical protein CEY00_Acc22788 [Actinidia chinensis var. chinensis]